MTPISVVVASFNGARKLPKLLSALARQTFSEFETLVVIDGSTDDSMAMLGRTEWGLSKLRVSPGPNLGRSGARNRGASEAVGQRLLFLDDDVEPEPSVVERHWVHGREQPESVLVGEVLEDEHQLHSDVQRYRAELRAAWAEALPRTKSVLTKDAAYITAANFSISSELFSVLGGFDERLSDCEDFDLALRSFEQSIPIIFDPSIVVRHQDHTSCRAYAQRRCEYRRGLRNLMALRPEFSSDIHQRFPAPALPPWKRAVYKAVGRPALAQMIDRFNVFLCLPKGLRYRLYSAVIWGVALNDAYDEGQG